MKPRGRESDRELEAARHLAGRVVRAINCTRSKDDRACSSRQVRGSRVRVFHRTSTENVQSILAAGFRDGEGRYMTDQVYRGVWVSDRPLDENQGAVGDCLVLMIIPDAVFEEYEWVEEGKPHREALIPAAVLNQFGQPTISNEDESSPDPVPMK